ncbi:TfoX/Sxy family DNA transformation protein [Vibrio panuliri]|uniref:DNA transformation protein n=1 Tax=Vibrio panuliri TaxID=1381081 RepID=A0A1Q9HE01_9VIBR|nr:TfoX/Sxy family DNA transformation protein [Vibrio panuliri]KAB1454876.1 TfoX/Sxy family DNA transformation protein [Vibrio panuliri]OLQ87957.1 DNA transformation protein [Vibrio panuliri]OLQ95246.1 DNA transformation protein [Vibrio panuliri]
MDKPILKDSMRLFEPLGRIKSRSMFGGFGIFADETMFALVVNNKLHIRADSILAKQFKQQGFEPYVYHKRGFPVVTKYFALSEDLYSNSTKTLEIAREAHAQAQVEKSAQAETKPTRIKDLPNLRLATERMLKKAGIDNVEQLQQAGSVEAYKAIRETHSSDVSLELLWSLEGAIKGTHWSVVPQERRDELLSRLQ